MYAEQLQEEHRKRRERLGFALALPEPEPEPKPKLDAAPPRQDEVRALEARVARLEAFFNEDVPNPRNSFGVRVAVILEAVCRFYEIPKFQLIGPRRTEKLLIPRMVGYYLCRELSGRSLATIAAHFGNRDHSTVLHGSNRIKARLDAGDSALAADIQTIKDVFR
jgi:chromosomal replication initiation ATPase DnaA